LIQINGETQGGMSRCVWSSPDRERTTWQEMPSFLDWSWLLRSSRQLRCRSITHLRKCYPYPLNVLKRELGDHW